MKQLLIVVLLFVINCSFAQTQADMNKEAIAAYVKADKELNDVYNKILTAYKSDNAFVNNLRASQRTWVTFRDAELNMRYPEREAGYYGSLHALCRATYLEELTKERTVKLLKWLQGREEAHICSGSIKVKG